MKTASQAGASVARASEEYTDIYTRPGSQMRELAELMPGPAGALGQLRQQIMRDGALSRKTKELLALGMALALRCDTSIEYHLADAREAGASSEEIIEAIGVALLMGGEPAAVHVWRALEVMERRGGAPKPHAPT